MWNFKTRIKLSISIITYPCDPFIFDCCKCDVIYRKTCVNKWSWSAMVLSKSVYLISFSNNDHFRIKKIQQGLWTKYYCKWQHIARPLGLHSSFRTHFSRWPLGHWSWPWVMYILSNGSESNVRKTPLRYSSQVSLNPNLFEYMSFWAHDKIAHIPLQSMQTWYFFSK